MNYSKIIIDTNKILAATIKPGRVRTILYQAPIKPIAPPHILEEAEKHAETLARKAKMSKEEFLTLLVTLLRDTTAQAKPIQPYIDEARKIASGFDPDDWPFIALALQHNTPIWTNDANIIQNSLKTRKYKALDTHALEMLLEGRSWKEIEEYLEEKYRGED